MDWHLSPLDNSHRSWAAQAAWLRTVGGNRSIQIKHTQSIRVHKVSSASREKWTVQVQKHQGQQVKANKCSPEAHFILDIGEQYAVYSDIRYVFRKNILKIFLGEDSGYSGQGPGTVYSPTSNELRSDICKQIRLETETDLAHTWIELWTLKLKGQNDNIIIYFHLLSW